MPERPPDVGDGGRDDSLRPPSPSESPPSPETTPQVEGKVSRAVVEGVACVELGAEVVNDGSSSEDDSEEDDAVAPWIRANFPSVKSERDVDELLFDGHAAKQLPRLASTLPLCDECAARPIAASCVDCALALCWRCADAIHIVPELAAHSVRLATAAIKDNARCEPCLSAGVDAVAGDHGTDSQDKSSTTNIPSASSPLPAVPCDDHHSSVLTTGSSVLFRAADCGRWPRELLHGLVASSSTTSATMANGAQRAFVRVLWLRGVEALADGSFRASLLLPAPRNRLSSIAPTAAIGVFPTRLGALRAVAVAEALARRSRRHVRAAAIINNHKAASIPTRTEIAQVRSEALDALDRLALASPLFPVHDERFLDEIVSGCWDLDKWLALTLGDELAREWQDEGLECRDSDHDDGDDVAWPPPRKQLVRFFSLDMREMSLPENERSRQLLRIVQQLLFMYAGFAWSRWRKFVQRHRRNQRRELETLSASKIQRWCRRRWERSCTTSLKPSSSLMNMARSMDELEQLYRGRQAAARLLFELLTAQWEKWMKRAVKRWAAASELSDPGVQRRIARVQHNATWHPSHGMSGGSGGAHKTKSSSDGNAGVVGSMLPTRLPRVFAHATPNGRVVVEDAARFQQFRVTHAGPTAASYWLLQGRVLLGAYPSASNQATSVGKARKGVSAVSSVAGGGDQRPSRAGKDAVTSVLLEQVNTFVCLMATRELQELEEQLERTEPLSKDNKLKARNQPVGMMTCWRFERLVRWRYDALLLELRAGEKRAARQLELALKAQSDAAELVATRQASRRSTAQDVADAEQELEMATARSELARQHDATARAAVSRLSMRLEFVHLPIRKDGSPGDGEDVGVASPEMDVKRALELVMQVEERLRAGQSVFVFSRDGHGRTGLVGALLLGRLYGLAAREALERVQRVHDCQPRYQSLSTSSSSSTTMIPASPTSARHVALVRSALAVSTDAIYAPLTRENSAEAFISRRAATRGLLGAPLLGSDGALLSEEPDETQRKEQLAALKGEQRVAAREAAGHKRASDRRREASEQSVMQAEDRDVEEDEHGEVSRVLAAVMERVEGLDRRDLIHFNARVLDGVEQLVAVAHHERTAAHGNDRSFAQVDPNSTVKLALEARDRVDVTNATL